MASNESSSVPARLKDLKDSVKERFLGLLGIRQPKVLLEDEQEVFLQVGRTVWHAPRQLRIELWLSSLARRHSLVSEYQAYLTQDVTREAANDIEKDVQRTFPNTRRFHSEEGQTQLRNVLRAYAAYDPEVAYCQGMNFLTGLLLMYMPSEAHAFAALVVLMEDRKLRSFYHRSMSLLQVQLWQLSRLISPTLNVHLETLGVMPMLYGASWLMTAFSADFPIPFSARIMDVLLADQCECALLKVAAAIMKAVGPRLLAMSDLEEVLGFLKLEVPAWDEGDLHDLLAAAFTKPWTARQLSILRSTEGAETVAQAVDRVLNMQEQMSTQPCDEDDGGEDGGDGGGGGTGGDGRMVMTVPRLQPPPQPSNSFTASPACGTPINGGLYDTGSHGGAASGSPSAAVSAAAETAAAAAAAVVGIAGGGSKCGGGGDAVTNTSMFTGMSSSSGVMCSNDLVGAASVGGSPAAWGIPCIHPNVPASPAIQAFRRAHLPNFQAAISGAAVGRNSIAFNHHYHHHHHHHHPYQHHQQQQQQHYHNHHIPSAPHVTPRDSCGGHANGGGGGGGAADDVTVTRPYGAFGSVLAGMDVGAGGSPQGTRYHSQVRRGSEGSSPEEWGDFNVAAVRQQWRSIVRAAPGSTRHVLLHSEESLAAAAAAAGAASTLSSCGGGGTLAAAPPTPSSRDSSSGSASQPIPVPFGRNLSSSSAINSAFAAAAAAAAAAAGGGSGGVSSLPSAAAAGKPPLPPRCASSLDRASGTPLLGPFSRLSVVTEDPMSALMGSVAPAPSPRGSLDLNVLGRSGSQQLESCEQQGQLLCGVGGGGGGGGGGGTAAPGSASCNGDCMSGTASATTGGALLSPTAISGTVSPQILASPRVLVGWSASGLASGGGGGGSAGGATGSETPTAGYMPLGLERAPSSSILDCSSHYRAAGVGGILAASHAEQSFSLVSPLAAAAAAAVSLMPSTDAPLCAPLQSQSQSQLLTASLAVTPQPLSQELQEQIRGGLQQQPEQQQQQQQEGPQTDMTTDIAGDILRMLSAVDTGNAHAAYDPRVILGESMYADSPNKEKNTLVRKGSESLRDFPSSSALADLAVQQDLVKAQEEAERVRQELNAQLQIQRSSERCTGSSCAYESVTAAAAAAAMAPALEGSAAALAAAAAGGSVGLSEAQITEAAAEAAVTAATAVAAATAAERAVTGGGAAAGTTEGTLAGKMSSGGGGGGGGEELVFKRPTLYVDGIPMFDPKSLMADTHEAQVMFTPTVSPGTSSYADPGPSGFTPTGDAATPAPSERDGGGDGTSAAAAPDRWDNMPHAAVRSSESGEEDSGIATDLEEAAAAVTHGSTDCCAGEEGVAAGKSLTTVDAVAKVAARRGSADGTAAVPALDASQCRAAADAAEAAVATDSILAAAAEKTGELRMLPSASEWVDWSQAPPIQVVAPVVIPLSEPPVAAAAAAPSETASSQQLVVEAAALVAPSPGPSSQSLYGRTSCALVLDLIDMASPARPLPPSAAAHLNQRMAGADGGGGAAAVADMSVMGGTTGTGTGLSPVPSLASGLVNSGHMPTGRQPIGSFSDLAAASTAAAGDGFCGSSPFRPPCCPSSLQQPTPYGLLPMTSGVMQPAPMAPALSFAAVSTAAVDGPSCSGSFVGGPSWMIAAATAAASCSPTFAGAMNSHGPCLMSPRYDLLSVNARLGSGNGSLCAIPYGSGDESDGGVRNCEEDGDDGGGCDSRRATDASAGMSTSPLLASPPSTAMATAAMIVHGEEHFPQNLGSLLATSAGGADAVPGGAAAADGDHAAGTGDLGRHLCGACPSLLVVAEVTVSEPSAQEQDEPSSDGDCYGAEKNGVGEVAIPPYAAGFGSETYSTAGLGGLESGDPEHGGRGSDPGCGFGPAAASVEPQDSLELEAEVGGSSPFSAALSPSLAHHIMSAYLRSNQHQQQQEQRELEERQQREVELLKLQQQLQVLPPSLGPSGVGPQHLAMPGLGLVEAAAAAAAAAASCDCAVVALSTAAAPAMAAPVPLEAAVAAVAVANSGASGAFSAVGAHLAVMEELSLCGVAPTTAPTVVVAAAPTATASGIVSPVLNSPGRPAAGYAGSGVYGSASVASQLPHHLLQQAAAKAALTPFALSLEDPSVCRLSAELLQSMPPPPPPLLLQPDTLPPPLPLPPLQLMGAVCSLAADCRGQLSGRTSLRCTGSGDGDGGVGGAATRRSASGAAQLQVSLLGHGSQNEGVGTAGAECGLPVPFAVAPSAAAAATAALQPLTSQACSARSCNGSAGGAALPLLPPPPPPQVPLCQTAVRIEFAGALPSAPPPAQHGSLPPPLPLPPVLCSSNATVLCVADGDGSSSGAACTPVAAVTVSGCCATTTTITTMPQAAPPTWTATFDGIDDTPRSDASVVMNGSGPAPRILSSAFAALADTPPQRPTGGSYGSGGPAAATAAAVTTTCCVTTTTAGALPVPEARTAMTSDITDSSTSAVELVAPATSARLRVLQGVVPQVVLQPQAQMPPPQQLQEMRFQPSSPGLEKRQ